MDLRIELGFRCSECCFVIQVTSEQGKLTTPPLPFFMVSNGGECGHSLYSKFLQLEFVLKLFAEQTLGWQFFSYGYFFCFSVVTAWTPSVPGVSFFLSLSCITLHPLQAVPGSSLKASFMCGSLKGEGQSLN